MVDNTLNLEKLYEISNGDADEQLRMIDLKFSHDEFAGNFPVRTLKYNFLEKYNHFSNDAESILCRIADYKLIKL